MPGQHHGRMSVLSLASALAFGLSTGPIAAAGFTEEQATAGATAYRSSCAACHGVQLEGPQAPGLAGQDVMGNWSTAGGLYDFISVAMPPTEPGKLGEETYLNIVAYIMKFNGAEPGDKALTTADMASVNLVDETKEGAAKLAEANQETTIEAGDTNVPQAFTWGKTLPQYKPEPAPAAASEPAAEPATAPAAEPETEKKPQ